MPNLPRHFLDPRKSSALPLAAQVACNCHPGGPFMVTSEPRLVRCLRCLDLIGRRGLLPPATIRQLKTEAKAPPPPRPPPPPFREPKPRRVFGPPESKP